MTLGGPRCTVQCGPSPLMREGSSGSVASASRHHGSADGYGVRSHAGDPLERLLMNRPASPPSQERSSGDASSPSVPPWSGARLVRRHSDGHHCSPVVRAGRQVMSTATSTAKTAIMIPRASTTARVLGGSPSGVMRTDHSDVIAKPTSSSHLRQTSYRDLGRATDRRRSLPLLAPRRIRVMQACVQACSQRRITFERPCSVETRRPSLDEHQSSTRLRMLARQA
jgi:hypothetical protein